MAPCSLFVVCCVLFGVLSLLFGVFGDWRVLLVGCGFVVCCMPIVCASSVGCCS